MRKFSIILCLLTGLLMLTSVEDANAQRRRKRPQTYRHTIGSSALEGAAALGEYGQVYSFGVMRHFTAQFYGRAIAKYEMGEYFDLSFNSYGLDVDVIYNAFSSGKLYFFNVSGGLAIGLDEISQRGNFEIDTDDTGQGLEFKYGLSVGIEPEFFISNKISIYGYFKEYVFLNSSYGTTRFAGGVGLRFFL